jgi:hypothetical protein
MPDLMEQLAGGDEPVEYYSHDPQKHDLCRQATLMALALFWEGGGWQGVHDAALHAAVGRLGFLKVFREEKLCFEDHDFQGLTPDVVSALAQQPGHLLLETEDEYEEDMNGMPYLARRSGQVRRYYVEDRIKVEAPDPATMFATQCVDLEDALCVGQKTTLRMGNLRSDGLRGGRAGGDRRPRGRAAAQRAQRQDRRAAAVRAGLRDVGAAAGGRVRGLLPDRRRRRRAARAVEGHRRGHRQAGAAAHPGQIAALCGHQHPAQPAHHRGLELRRPAR